ncbi:small nuclear RNA activating complex, polypeptide 3, partial [Goodea atripinnis]
FNYVRPHMTLLMTGSHTLAELRDAICCVSDLQVCGEFSSTPDMAPDFISKVSTAVAPCCTLTQA